MSGEILMNGHASMSSRSTSPQEQQVQQQPEPEVSIPNAQNSRESSRLVGAVKWFNAKNGYGFITRQDNGEDVFVHFSGIARKNPRHFMKSLGDGELVEFNIMATNVTGPLGRPVRGNPYVSFIPIRRTDSFASGDPVMLPHQNYQYVHRPALGNSRIPRWSNWARN